ncbi:uncharacterized protein Bfra_005268 [Botrytis fragariae]|uniref:Uncharacterized protein n=1 Tax=Botrytis fragariae TaxID=1964551 RepID=A0A8H6AUG6_9HELO|nr:uncharacterized protein Bfra_005268 [Botrytis fragariae]KAF5873801.1 hypothetical protein Bfra_005268 [Botrytis fragariae]
MISKHHGVVLSVRCQPLSVRHTFVQQISMMLIELTLTLPLNCQFQYHDRNVWSCQWTVTVKHGEHALMGSRPYTDTDYGDTGS